MGRVTVRRQIVRFSSSNGRDGPVGPVGPDEPVGPVGPRRRLDTLAVEEPLEIRLSGRPLSVTMRTPGDDFDLVPGFLHGEGVITAAGDIVAMRYCAPDDPAGEQLFNVLDVTLSGPPPAEVSLDRSFYMTSACGVCGKTSIDAIRQRARYDVPGDRAAFPAELLVSLPSSLRAGQRVFSRTGGLHAAGLFKASGSPLAIREDVGRHNAVDKVIGWALKEKLLPLTGHVLVVSGRASFELTQKALLAGVPAMVAVSAPSSLAVELAAESGMTLAGFARGDGMNVYTGAERIT